ncbi:MAG: hypothetical protein ACKVT0_01350 [Planctomycetaceae bacterium]
MAAIQRVRRYIAIWLICWCAAWAANLPSAMAESPDWLTASPRPSASTGLDDTPASVDLETPPSLFTFSSPVVLTSFNQNEVENENENDEEGPEHIRDNAFLVEEAFNQEAGEVQHIFNWIDLRSRSAEPKARDFAWTYTMEIPLGSQKHQFSFTSLMLDAYEKPAGGPATRTGGVGDTLLNYRYQLLADDDFLWCAPRITLIVPTGDERFGLGNGEAGYQFNLPISSYGEMFDSHANAGFT